MQKVCQLVVDEVSIKCHAPYAVGQNLQQLVVAYKTLQVSDLFEVVIALEQMGRGRHQGASPLSRRKVESCTIN